MAHLMAAGELLDEDPALAQAHAMAARRRAARLPIVREAAAEAAYANGDFATALTEYRAVSRMTGNPNYLPVIADSERALGKHDQALRTIREAHNADLDVVQEVELVLVEAGLRDDMEQRPEGLRLLRKAISDRLGPKESQARLRYAYANLLQQEGNESDAVRWFEASQALDVEADLDADDRLRDLGVDVPEKEPDFDEEDYLLIQEEEADPEPEVTESQDDSDEGLSPDGDEGSDGAAAEASAASEASGVPDLGPTSPEDTDTLTVPSDEEPDAEGTANASDEPTPSAGDVPDSSEDHKPASVEGNLEQPALPLGDTPEPDAGVAEDQPPAGPDGEGEVHS
ncbi:MAG: hypothetical protein L0H80_03920 [Propionibacterium sp.]|nr:hypothetical protein [Propionibacterium sp.]